MKRVTTVAIAASLAVLTTSALAFAQQAPAPTESGGAMLARVTVPAKSGATLTVSSPAFANAADIPFENTQYRGNIFPGLSWTSGPGETKSYAVIMQDADALVRGAPILHWTMVNIPVTVTQLAAAMSTPPDGAQYGPNVRGTSQPYLGPHTPPGPKHRYHIQVFALDTMISLESMLNYATLTAAMKDHVLASGELIGLGQVAPAATSAP